MPNYPCLQYERVFSRCTFLWNHVQSHDSVVNRVLREIADEVEEEVICEQQLMEIDVSDNEQEDVNNDKQENTSDNEWENTSDNERENTSDNEREDTSDNKQEGTSNNEPQIELSDNEH